MMGPSGILTFSYAIDEPVTLVDAFKALFKAYNVFGNGVVYLLVAGVYGAATFFQWIPTLVKRLFCVVLKGVILVNGQLVDLALRLHACLRHDLINRIVLYFLGPA
jgi:hypothetical protein